MNIKPKTGQRVIGARRLFFSGLIFLMLTILGVLLFWYVFSENWRSMHVGMPEGTIEIEDESEDLSEPEMNLYSEKYDEARSILGSISLTDTFVVIDVSEQKEYIFTLEGDFVTQYRVSTGGTRVRSGTEVDADGVAVPVYQDRSMGQSIWRVSEKLDGGLSALYGPRLMYLERLISGKWTGTDVALHGTDQPELLGTPTSLGCVNHDNADIIELYDRLDVGTLVVSIR